ncbi:MAG TPA: 6-bladed beta-propeller [Burkholderiales bacterium]|nr:6-bladed beta-propeller [Burkholderiales bacterium]
MPAGATRLAGAMLCALALGVLLAGCASAPRELRLDIETAPDRKRIVWPLPPEVPRYAWAGELLGEDNFQRQGEPSGSDGGFLRWLAGVILGESQQPVRVQRPQAGAIDAAGRIYVTDAGNSAVFVFDAVAGELVVWDKAEPRANFLSPVGIAVGPGGDILVADSRLGIVARLDARGNPRRSIGRGVLKRPTGLAYDPVGGRIYVSDTAAHDIKAFDDDGRLVKTIGHRGEGDGEFNFPTHLAFAHGELYVTDTMNSRIQVLGEAGTVVRLRFGARGTKVGNLVRPKGVAVDSEGNIYVVESYYDHLLVFSPRGELLLALDGGMQGIGGFELPAGVWVDGSDRVFVADMLNARIPVFQFLGSTQ